MDDIIQGHVSIQGDDNWLLVFCASWAVTLRAYTSSNVVSFAVRIPTKFGGRGETQAIYVRIGSQKKIHDVVQNIREQISSYCQHREIHVPDSFSWETNTLLTFSTQDTKHDHMNGHLGNFPSVGIQCTLLDEMTSHIRITNDRTRFSAWQAQRMIEHFMHAQRQIKQSAFDTPLSSTLTLPPEHVSLLRKWNGYQLLEEATCIHHVVEANCTALSGAIAIDAWDISLTYRELATESTTLAHKLRRLNVGPGRIVPLLFERSGWTVIAILATLRAGAAFFLVDAAFPDERVRQMCGDVKAAVGVCCPQQSHRMANVSEHVVVVPSSTGEDPEMTPLPTVTHRSPAYVAFTSGSTGRPKGVVIEHAAFCTSARGFQRLFRNTPELRMFQGSSHAFDVSLMEIMGTLLYGGCVCVPSETDKRRDMAAAIDHLQANVAMMTPSVLRLLDPTRKPSSLQTIVIGGERATPGDLETWANHVHLSMGYGPAECAVNAMGHADLGVHSDPLNIGLPSTECCCWVVDREFPDRLAAIGALGELVIEGPIVGRGYIARPDLTARNFSQTLPPWRTPFGPSSHGFYWTGDLVRSQPDGSFQIAGRKDDQVKLHGQRIELGEIERTIHNSLPAGYNVVVSIVAAANGQAEFLAVFIYGIEWASHLAHPGDEPMHLFIREKSLPPAFLQIREKAFTHAQQHLPRFMIPTLWVPLAQPAPLTTNGKMDRKRLSKEAATLSPMDRRFYTIGAVSSDMHQSADFSGCKFGAEFQRLVATVLGGVPEEIDLNASFLALGGDSLSAMKICSLARKLNIQLDSVELLQAGSLLDFAANLGEIEAVVSPISLLSVSPSQLSNLPEGTLEAIVPATELQEFFMDLPFDYMQYHLHGSLDMDQLTRACRALVERHGMLRTILDRDRDGGELFQVIFQECHISLDVHICDEDAAVENVTDLLVQREYAGETQRLRLGEWGARFSLITSKQGQQHVLLLRFAHSHFDGGSIVALWDDLAALYANSSQMTAVPSFSQYRAHCDAQITAEALQFWRKLLKQSSMTYVTQQKLPLNPGRLVKTHRVIPSVQSPSGITLATVIKTAWAITLATFRGGDDIVFGQVVSGRSGAFPGIESVVGPCMNTIPVRVRLSNLSETTGTELLHQVQSQHLQSLRYEATGFSTIRNECANWSEDIQFGSLVLHQNMLPRREVALGQCVGVRRDFYPEETTNEFIIYSIPSPDNDLEIRLATSQDVLDQKTADGLVASLCGCIGALLSHPRDSVHDLMKTA
ncbi:unnamed protein product [Penicillium egyptiacum]|uniref:Carrier domain-containing protein n=1 Tax=Penicillium egyptiacum TaxID=1303716 RepID=A0A9W4KLK4_9EURO|nr:unnamed protein product [Penicillium egyptiacum]